MKRLEPRSEMVAAPPSGAGPHHIEFLDRFSQANTNSFRASLLLSSLAVFGLWGYLPHNGLLVWLFAVWTAQTAHEAYSRYYRKHRGNGPDEYRRWVTGFRLGAAVVGACWSLPFFLLDGVAYDMVLLLVFPIAGVTAYGGVARATVLSVALIFEFAVLLPLCVWLFWQDSNTHHIMGAVALLYLAMLTPLLRKMNLMVTRTLLLDGENHRLSDEQKRHLERLHLSEDEYRTLADNLPVAVVRYDAEQRRRYINPVAERILQGTTTQMLGLVPGEGGVPATPAMIARYRSRMAEVMASGEACEFEFLLDALPQGGLQRYEVRMAPEYGADGKIAGALAIWFDITERKRMEEELKLKEHVLDQAHDGVYLIGEQARFVYVNDEACRALGYSREELLGMGVQDIDSSFSVEALHAITRKTREEGLFAFETQHRRRDGSMFPVEIQASATVYQGKHLGLALARDISERKQAALALEESNALLRSVLQGIPDPVWMKDVDGTLVVCNQGVARLLNKPVEEVIGKDDYDFFPPDRAALYRNKDRAVLEAGRVIVDEEWWSFADTGEQAWMETCKTPVRSPDGKLLGVLGVARDITERKNAQSRLEMLHLAINQISDALFVQDDSLRFVAVNDAACRALGYSREELAKMSTPDIEPGCTREKVVSAFVTAELEKPVCYETQHSTKDGRLIPVEVTGTLFEIDGVRHVVVVARDITERKRIEATLATRARAFSSLAEKIPENVVRWDTEGRYLYVNPTHERTLGKRLADLIGRCIPDSHGRVKAGIAQVAATGQMVHVVRQRVVVDGVEELHDVSLAPEFDETGTVVSVLGLGRNMTEIYRMQEIIANERAMLRAFFGAMPNLVWMKDMQGCYLVCNPMFEQFYCATEAEIVGKTDFDFVDAELATFLRQKDLEAEAAGQPCVNEEWVTCACDGRRVLLETVRSPVFNAEGQLVGVIGVAHDITSRKRYEDALQEHGDLLKAIMDSSPEVLVFALDTNYRYLSFNGKLRQVMQAIWGKEIAVGMNMLEVMGNHADREVNKQRCDRALAGESFVDEIVYGDEALSREYWQTYWAPIRSNSGEVTGLTCFVLNASERRRAEESLRRSERLMRAVIDATPDWIFVKDRLHRYQLVNKSYADSLRIEPKDFIGKDGLELGFPEDQVKGNPAKGIRGFWEDDQQVLESNQAQIYPDHSVTVAGEVHTFHTIKVPLCDDEGNPWGVMALARDITERKRMEQALAKREQEFRTLVENSVDTVARYGRDLSRLYVNPAFAALVEGGAAKLLGRTPAQCPGGPNAVMYESKLSEVFAEGRGTGFELKWLDGTGREMCSLINLTPEFDANGQVASVLAVGRDITELNASRHKIHQMAFYDPLTALPNRALFNDRLRQMINDAAWHGQQAGLILMDMDRFKVVNDTLGHAAGDELLRETAERLNTCVRAYDTVARLGGDEFAILLPEVRSGDDLGRIASKMLALFQQPFLLEGKEVFVSCSIGIALYPGDSTEADDLLKYADSAMYFAKRSGRNNFRFYSRDLTESSHERLVLESDLRRAVEREELELFYQPKVRLCDGTLVGSEALLRWRHPERGMVPPNAFIDIAEDSGLIGEIGEWVLHEACRTASRWNGEGKPLHKVAINLSARQFQGGDLAATVCRALEESGCRAEWIELEITESLLLDEESEVLEVLNRFRAMGIAIAIDDFGTGYSALSYLARFPIATLKIDRSFISSLETDTYRAELVKAILSIARCLGQQVVAEGVETPAQAEFLSAHGCHLAQGYLYGRPIPVPEFERLPLTFDRGWHGPETLPAMPTVDG